jgi:tetratricopeptide (TPR) repeat protein
LQRDLSVSYQKVGDIMVVQGDLAGALASYKDSLAVIDRVAKTDFGNAGWQADLAGSSGKLGQLYTRLGDKAEARRYFERGRAIVTVFAERSGNQLWIGYLKSFDRDLAALDAQQTSGRGEPQTVEELAKAIAHTIDANTIRGGPNSPLNFVSASSRGNRVEIRYIANDISAFQRAKANAAGMQTATISYHCDAGRISYLKRGVVVYQVYEAPSIGDRIEIIAAFHSYEFLEDVLGK